MDSLLQRLAKGSIVTIILWLKRLLFILVLLGSGYLAYHFFVKNILSGDHVIFGFIGAWAVLAYFILPRLNRLFAKIYVPDYFIGRVRTGDGLLGDPVNLALLGNKKQLIMAMEKSGWIQSDDLSFKANLKIISSVVLRKSYPTAPVSSLFLFNRKQDLAFQQEVDGKPNRRHHVRFWRVPKGWLMPGGYKVDWLAAGTYDKSVGFSAYTLQFTHKIAENVDEERDYIIESLKTAKATKSVKIIKSYSSGYHHRNGDGDSISTDGAMPIITL